MRGLGQHEQRQHEFAELQQKADEILLDRSLLVSATPLELTFQLCVQPAFSNHVSWTIFSDKFDLTCLVRQVIWDKAFDGIRFSNPMEGLKHGWHTSPTTTTHFSQFNSFAAFDSMLNEARQFAIEEPQSAIILDGVRWSIYLPGYFEDRTITWNSAVQNNQELVKWTVNMADYFKAVFKIVTDE